MGALAEWRFEFTVTAAAPIPYLMMDDLMWLEAVGWAERRGLGIGGSFGPGANRPVPADPCWRFRFGLCVQPPGRLIPESQATELWELLRDWCRVRDLNFVGQFGPFEPSDDD